MLDTWQEWVGTFTGVVATTVFALPLAVLAVGVLRWRRRKGDRPWRTALADVGMVYGTVPPVWMILLPGERLGEAGEVSLVPLRDLLSWDTGQVVGNLLVFAALGFFAPLRFPVLASVPRVLALGAACSVVVETAQYVLLLDRVSSVDDVLLNATGAGLAAVLSWPWWRAGYGGDMPGSLGSDHAGADRGGRALPGRSRP
ncbi:teicoplanin resistance protein VanZ [Lentzea guizhouensis]|uniref:Teicoplanin resistance protein VanZ n=1 Tax=Lentzea guizhouensis TaxID=1586287 RepID=A0A1B2HDS7_9PSEU|nr:VanZ family protein [Lentzea guizhouensis]ANZ35863.1 teicoplanin resistance protein VanZ [Lentzea guizhouensis]